MTIVWFTGYLTGCDTARSHWIETMLLIAAHCHLTAGTGPPRIAKHQLVPGACPSGRCQSVGWAGWIQSIYPEIINFTGIKEHTWWTCTGSCLALELGGLAFCSLQQATSSHDAKVYSQSCNSLISSLILYSSVHLRCLSHSLFHKAFKHVLYGMSHQVVSWRMYFSTHWALSRL